MSILNELVKIYKANPFHAVDGRFTSSDNAVHITKPKPHHSEAVKQHFANARSEKAKNIKEDRVKFKNTFGVSKKVFNTDPAFKILRDAVNKEKELLKEQADLEKRIENKRRNSERNSHKDLVRQRDLKVEIERNNQQGFKHLIRDANWKYKSKNKAQKSELAMQVIRKYQGY